MIMNVFRHLDLEYVLLALMATIIDVEACKIRS